MRDWDAGGVGNVRDDGMKSWDADVGGDRGWELGAGMGTGMMELGWDWDGIGRVIGRLGWELDWDAGMGF